MSHTLTTLTNEELVLRIQRGEDVNDNLQQLYDQNTGLIYKKYVRQYLTEPEEFDPLKEDLMQEAFLGLWEATKRYKSEAGCKFMSYAGFWIRQRISRYCKSCCQSKRIPEYYLQQIRSYQSFIKTYRNEHQEYPATEQISEALCISREKVEELQRIIVEADALSLEEAVPGTDLTVVDTIPDDTDIGEQAAAAADREALWKIVDSLDYQKRTVIRLHFYDDHDLTKISKRLGMSIQNVSRIKKDAIRILRKKEAIRNLAMDYGYSGAYKGSLQSFRNSGMSCVERIALKNVSIEEQRKKIFSELANLKIAYQKGGENENE